jgi:hypothetical protein
MSDLYMMRVPGSEPDAMFKHPTKRGIFEAAARFIPPEMRRRGRDLRDALTVENTVDAGLAAAEFTDYGDLKLMQGGVDKMFSNTRMGYG